jgi:hypothetical protein
MSNSSDDAWNPSLQRAVLVGLGSFLRPLARFLLRSGIGYKEFSDICKAAFVSVASDEYGVRGRSCSLSRIAAVTGISRKETARLRGSDLVQVEADFWASELNPLTQILHFWHSDPDYSTDGRPRPLAFADGEYSFASLVSKYAADIPPTLARFELKRCGATSESSDEIIHAIRRQYTPSEVDVEFVRTMVFSLKNITNTLAHNADVILREGPQTENGRLERYAWTTRISESSMRDFRVLSEQKAEELLLQLDTWIGERERVDMAQSATSTYTPRKSCGFGVYYFEDD